MTLTDSCIPHACLVWKELCYKLVLNLVRTAIIFFQIFKATISKMKQYEGMLKRDFK